MSTIHSLADLRAIWERRGNPVKEADGCLSLIAAVAEDHAWDQDVLFAAMHLVGRGDFKNLVKLASWDIGPDAFPPGWRHLLA